MPVPINFDVGDQRVPGSAGLPDQFPNSFGCSPKLNAFRYTLQIGVRLSEVRKIFSTWLRRLGCPAFQEFTVMVHHPRQQNVDDIGVDCTPATGLIGLPVDRALLDFR